MTPKYVTFNTARKLQEPQGAMKMSIEQDEIFLRQAIALANRARQAHERPFGAILVLNDKVVAESQDQCWALNDPTAHAELRLISDYCQQSRQFDLNGATIYTCAEPCVMCSGAIKWAGISRVVFSVSQEMLQNFSGGLRKPTCNELVNTGGRHIDVIGLLLLDEGLACYKEFDFSLHRQNLINKYH
jgi:tRNA(adenine34) deaminase